jgi:hypothetical protein
VGRAPLGHELGHDGVKRGNGVLSCGYGTTYDELGRACSDGSGRRLSTTVYSCEGTVTTAVTTDASGAETGRVVTTRDEMGNVLRQEHSGEDPVTYTYTYRRTEGPAA